MTRHPQLTPWRHELASRFPDLPGPVVAVLALYSFGVLLAGASGLSSVVLFLSSCLGLARDALRKRLREFYLEAEAKSGVRQGVKRKDFDVASCFAPLLRWLLSLWSGRQLALAIDVTNLGDRFHVLCVSVVVRGVAIPVAWKVLLGGVKEAWGPHWEKLLGRLKAAVPEGWTVLVLSDRGLESPELFRFITKQDWHPLMRVKKGGKFRPKGWQGLHHFHQLVRRVGDSFYAEGTAYTGAKLPCTLLACWAEGYDEPWLVLTDLAPECADAVWYGLRGWIEQGFKVIKGGRWDWHKTRMEDPARVERLWLVLAVATLWVVAIGAEDEAREEADEEWRRWEQALAEAGQQARAREERERHRRRQQQEGLQRRRERLQKRQEARKQARAPKAKGPRRQAGRPTAPGGSAGRPRAHRVSERGLAALRALGQRGRCRLPRCLHPEPWPEITHSASALTEEDFLAQQT